MNKTKHVESKKPRKLIKITHSKYEANGALNANKEYWNKVFDDLHTTCETPTIAMESRRLYEVLPYTMYQKVCDTLNIPIIEPVTDIPKKALAGTSRRCIKEPLLSYRKSLYIDREMDSDTDVECDVSDVDEGPNVHKELLKKPEREQITWNTRYLQPERDDEKSLITKAHDVTERIANEFCQYMKELGGDQTSQLFCPDAIKDLFQIEYDTPVSRGLRVISKELPSVLENIANISGHPEKSQYSALEREVSIDIKEEKRPDRVLGFNTSLPMKEQWRAPRNDTENMWRSAKHVPKDLVTLKTVWEGITNLRSVREYCRWMIDHPEHRRAPYLSSLGMFDPAVLQARLTMELTLQDMNPTIMPVSPTETPAPIDQIRKRLSQLAETK